MKWKEAGGGGGERERAWESGREGERKALRRKIKENEVEETRNSRLRTSSRGMTFILKAGSRSSDACKRERRR